MVGWRDNDALCLANALDPNLKLSPFNTADVNHVRQMLETKATARSAELNGDAASACSSEPDAGNGRSLMKFLQSVGTLTLGDLNKDKCDASRINWHPLQAPYGTPYFPYYATKVDQISLGDHVFTLDKKITWTAKFTPENDEVLFAPAIIADDIAKRVGANVEIDGSYHYY
ncbi:hypothetical protein AAVH_23035 [Aphelenchoides avenae]|nr:hypothetical protein AAVH_23035 [Aphelenchus avenae]